MGGLCLECHLLLIMVHPSAGCWACHPPACGRNYYTALNCLYLPACQPHAVAQGAGCCLSGPVCQTDPKLQLVRQWHALIVPASCVFGCFSAALPACGIGRREGDEIGAGSFGSTCNCCFWHCCVATARLPPNCNGLGAGMLVVQRLVRVDS